MKNKINKFILVVAISFGMFSCHNDLDQFPIDPDSFTEQDVFANAIEAKSALAKLYASLAVTGQQGGDSGQPDISDIDQGFSQFTRMLFNLNELTTDHAVVGWGDPGLPDLHGMYWTGSNDFSGAMYLRLAQEVSFCNSFIKNASTLTDPEVQDFIAEARFLRAYAYYNLIDLFANVPLVKEISLELPSQSSRTELFKFVEEELLELQDLLPESQANEYGRVDKVAAWALLSRLYLNADVWEVSSFVAAPKTGWQLCVEFSTKVMNSSYSLNTTDLNGNGSAYDELFLADNDTNGAQNEFIFPILFDGKGTNGTRTYGGSTFLIHGATGGSMDPTEFGINGGWGGYRTTKAMVEKFEPLDFDIASLNNSLGGTLSDWGLVGDATEYGWNPPDIHMYETATNQYAVYAQLYDGPMKFRLNEMWDVNYGDTNADGSLELNGDNIEVSAGIYLLTLDLDNLTYSITAFEPPIDKRAMFYTDGQNLEIASIPPFKEGYAVTKFRNVDVNGDIGNDTSGEFTDTDLPMIRLAEIYLNYAEATLQGGGGDEGLALERINDLRKRANGDTSGNITLSDLTLDFVLDERSRELYWEGTRRTDLIRYNRFTTGNYIWPWKGNQPNGVPVGAFRKIFPIPNNTILTNPNLKQNDGY